MKVKSFYNLGYNLRFSKSIFALFIIVLSAKIALGAPLRRPVSPQQPMWLIHIDTWNYPDPQKIIELVPEDIRPYVVMNISLSISHDAETSRFRVAEYGYEIAKSWLRACAENQMWAMIQPSSGGFTQFPDGEMEVFEEFYRDYPNLIGFNYCEQFWGYDDPSDPLSPAWTDRFKHLAELLKMSRRYGGYVTVSWCGNQWSPPINPIGMLKRVPEFEEACRSYTENFILCEKYTQQSYQHDMESLTLGYYLSGYSGNYGIRYDDTGWTNVDGVHDDFILSTGGAPHLEHAMLTGQTVIDGPELIWRENFRETSRVITTDGYSARNWETFPQFDNFSIDLFRKILDGTARIPTREEVVARTKVAIINDVNSGNPDAIYSTPASLFEGLYQMDSTGNLRENYTFFKKTGRYPTIPTVYALDDELAKSFEVQVLKSDYESKWPTVADKVQELDTLFPEEYTGDIYAGRHENGWVVYNPYKTGQNASGSIPFKYNTSEKIDLELSQYTSGVMKEFADKITLYLTNYDEDAPNSLKTNTIKVSGSSIEPTYDYSDRADHAASVLQKDWTNGVLTLTVQHNGPLDITINCAGTATDRLTQFTTATLIEPAAPRAFPGPRQYEAEVFEYQGIANITTQGQNGSIRNYRGQGYLQFGTGASASVRDTVSVLKAGTYRLETRYSVTGSDVQTVDLYVNEAKVSTPLFQKTDTLSDWKISTQDIVLDAGENTIEMKASAAAPSSLFLDAIVVVPTEFEYSPVVQEGDPSFTRVDGAVSASASGYSGSGYADSLEEDGAEVEWALSFDDSTVKSFVFRYSSQSTVSADLLVNGKEVASDLLFAATPTLNNWEYVSAYAAVSQGAAKVILRADTDSGLPNIDSLEVQGGKPWTDGELPFSPLGVSASSSSTTAISLNWEPAPGASAYTLMRATQPGGPYATVADGITGLYYLDTGLDELTTYYYVLTATNSEGESAVSAETNATTKTSQPPAVPEGVAVVASSYHGATVSWSSSLGAESYRLKRSFYSGGPYAVVESDIAGNAFTDTGLQAGLTYFYVVSGVNENGEGDHGTEVSLSTPTTFTIEPLADAFVRDGPNVDANFGSETTLVVKNDGSTGSGFNRDIYMKFDVNGLETVESASLVMVPYQVDNNVSLDLRLVADDSWNESEITWNDRPAAANTAFASKDGMAVDQNYTVAVTDIVKDQATEDGVLSLQVFEPGASNIFLGFNSRENANSSLRPRLSVSLPAAEAPPQIPGNPTVTILSESEIELGWDASIGANSYTVRRASSAGGPYEDVQTGIMETGTRISGLTAGERYFYVVVAVGANGESQFEDEIPAVPSLPLSDAEAMPVTFSMNGKTLRIALNSSVLGHLYCVEGKDDLTDDGWLGLGEANPGTGGALSFEIDLRTASARYFRLKIQRM